MGTFLKNEYIFFNEIIYIVTYTLNLLKFMYFKYSYNPLIKTFVMDFCMIKIFSEFTRHKII